MEKRKVIGRTIVGYESNRFADGRGGVAFNPVLTFDNGAQLRFVVQETDTGEHGVRPVLSRPVSEVNPHAK